MATRIQLRRDTAANWASSNPILSDGEIGIDTTADNFKIGDGVTAWNSLAAFSSGNGVWGSITGTLSNQTDVVSAINAKVADAINDGTTTIAPSQNAVFDALASKATNPMTTAGDIIVGGSSGTPARLAAGSTAGDVLTSNGAAVAPSWQTPTSGGGSLPTGMTWNNTTKTFVFGANQLTDFKWEINGHTGEAGDNPPFVQFKRILGGTTVGKGSVGYLGGTEMNISNNMDYSTGGHKYYDTTQNAYWLYLSNSTNEFGGQWTKAGHPNDDTMWSTYGKVIWKISLIAGAGGEAVQFGSKFYTQQIELIDDNLVSPSVLLKQSGTKFSITGPDQCVFPRTQIGTLGIASTETLTLQATGNNTYIITSNKDNNTNYNQLRFLKSKVASFNIGSGTKVYEFDIQGGIGFTGARATATVLSSFSNIEYYWRTTNAAGVLADRMVLGEDGHLKIQNIYAGSTTKPATAIVHLDPGTPAANTAPLKFSYTSIATTATSGNGTTATITFSTQAAAPFAVGSSIVVAGVTPSGYNGTYVVTGCTTTTVSFLSATTGAQTVAGTVGTGVLTSPEAGAVEYDGTQFYLTNSTATRYTVNKSLLGSAVLDFASTAAQTDTDLTITVTGAALGDPVVLGIPNGSTLAGGTFTAWVSSSNTVTVRFSNYSSSAKDPASGTFNVRVIK